jgi:hypothetical protein
MTKSCFIKDGHALVPADDDAAELLEKIAQGREVVVDVKMARHPKQHRAFFALLKILISNKADLFVSMEQALTAVKIAIGEVDTFVDTKTGKLFYVPRSIAFESCDQTRFSRIFDDTLSVICDRWLIGTDQEVLRAEVLAIVEDKVMVSLGQRSAA